LLLDVVNIPDEENAYFDILELNKLKLYKTIDDSSKLLEAEKLDLVQTKELFVNNKEALEILNNFSIKKFYQSPDLANPKVTSFDSREISYTKLRESVRILALKAKYELEIRNEGQSYKDTKIILDIGQKMTSSQCVLIEYLVGLSINKKGLESIARITKQTNNHSLLNTIDKELENYKPQVNKSVFKDDYIKAKNTISKSDFLDTLASWNPNNKYWNFLSEILYNNNFYYKQNETLNIIAKNTRQKVDNYQKKCSEKNIKEDVIYGDFNTFFMLTNRNSFGQSLSDFSKMQLSSVKDKRCENENIFLEIKSTLSEKLK
jgi:hypothetical protein